MFGFMGSGLGVGFCGLGLVDRVYGVGFSGSGFGGRD